MTYDAPEDDWQSLSLFKRRPASSSERLGGLAAAFTALVLMPGALVLTSVLVSALAGAVVGEAVPEEAPVEPEVLPVEVVEARFVRLGSTPDPRRLPSRYVPSASTAPALATPPPAVEAVPEATPEPPPAAPLEPPPFNPNDPRLRPPTPTQAPPATTGDTIRPADARVDALTRLGDRAEATAELSRPREREGDAEGIAEGTETRDNGDLYLGRLYSYFRRGWHVPTSIADAELRGLSCVVEVVITQDARVGNVRVVRSSGNDAFDASVSTRMNQAAGASLPAPPTEDADRFLGRAITLRFLGRHAR